MTSKTSAILTFLRNLLLGAAALAVMVGVALLAGKIYVLFQPDPSQFFVQAEEIKPGTWVYLLAAAVETAIWGVQWASVVVTGVLLLMLLQALGAEIAENWLRGAEQEGQALTAPGTYPIRDERIDGSSTEAWQGPAPWRGLYAPERLPPRHPEYGDTYHPDLPSWPDDEQQSIVPLLHAQGFEVQFVQGEFYEDVHDGDEVYWKEMRNWQPLPPAGDGWRLAAVGDTEDGPYATFVRPLGSD